MSFSHDAIERDALLLSDFKEVVIKVKENNLTTQINKAKIQESKAIKQSNHFRFKNKWQQGIKLLNKGIQERKKPVLIPLSILLSGTSLYLIYQLLAFLNYEKEQENLNEPLSAALKNNITVLAPIVANLTGVIDEATIQLSALINQYTNLSDLASDINRSKLFNTFSWMCWPYSKILMRYCVDRMSIWNDQEGGCSDLITAYNGSDPYFCGESLVAEELLPLDDPCQPWINMYCQVTNAEVPVRAEMLSYTRLLEDLGLQLNPLQTSLNNTVNKLEDLENYLEHYFSWAGGFTNFLMIFLLAAEVPLGIVLAICTLTDFLICTNTVTRKFFFDLDEQEHTKLLAIASDRQIAHEGTTYSSLLKTFKQGEAKFNAENAAAVPCRQAFVMGKRNTSIDVLFNHPLADRHLIHSIFDIAGISRRAIDAKQQARPVNELLNLAAHPRNAWMLDEKGNDVSNPLYSFLNRLSEEKSNMPPDTKKPEIGLFRTPMESMLRERYSKQNGKAYNKHEVMRNIREFAGFSLS